MNEALSFGRIQILQNCHNWEIVFFFSNQLLWEVEV